MPHASPLDAIGAAGRGDALVIVAHYWRSQRQSRTARRSSSTSRPACTGSRSATAGARPIRPRSRACASWTASAERKGCCGFRSATTTGSRPAARASRSSRASSEAELARRRRRRRGPRPSSVRRAEGGISVDPAPLSPGRPDDLPAALARSPGDGVRVLPLAAVLAARILVRVRRARGPVGLPTSPAQPSPAPSVRSS